MSESHVSVETSWTVQETTTSNVVPGEKAKWETPKMEDVTEEVMAQPYIRFT